MDWYRITVKTTTEGSDAVSDLLGQVSSGGVIIEDPADLAACQKEKTAWDYIDEHLADAYDPEVCVRGFTQAGEDNVRLLEEIRARAAELRQRAPEMNWGSLTVEGDILQDENWAETWKKFYKPFKPGMRIVIKPTWEPYTAASGELVLEMDPGAAFGTGTHETTRLCICLLEKYITPGMTVMDVGCGTGVLAMCASLLGAEHVLAIDIDPEAVRVAENNMKDFPIQVECGNLLEKSYDKADLIVANIIADAVMMLAPRALEHLRPAGIYLTSGIINERADEVQSAISAAGFTLLERLQDGEWTAMAWRK